MFLCEKKCNKKSISSRQTKMDNEWISECLNPPNKQQNIYTYCNREFTFDTWMLRNCEIDNCRLCCATNDQAVNGIKNSLNTVNECFSACADKFRYDEKKDK